MNRREVIRFVFLEKGTLVLMWRSDFQKQKRMWEKQEASVVGQVKDDSNLTLDGSRQYRQNG